MTPEPIGKFWFATYQGSLSEGTAQPVMQVSWVGPQAKEQFLAFLRKRRVRDAR